MDNLLLHSSKHDHLKYLEDLLKALLKNGLKISPKKYKIFRYELQYIYNTILLRTGETLCQAIKARL